VQDTRPAGTPTGPFDAVVVGGAIAIIVYAVTILVSARVNRCIVVGVGRLRLPRLEPCRYKKGRRLPGGP
jgi:hypothetical protein